MSTPTPLLEVEDLHLNFRSMRGLVRALDGVTLTLAPGEILGLVGESGCGKTVTGLSILGLLRKPQAEIPQGSIRFGGRELVGLSDAVMRRLRGKEIAMVFQDPLASLNPVFTIEDQISTVVRLHKKVSRREARDAVSEALQSVGLPATEAILGSYPHQLSGGMRQRCCLAMALSCGAPLLIADEPTTALDVTVQAQIMQLLKELQAESGMGLILITHDLGVVADVADRISVMYAGRIVESAGVHDLYGRPAHAYTKGLLDSIPRLDQRGQTLYAIGGLPPNLMRIPPGCPFNPRCVYATDVCRSGEPPALVEVLPRRLAACHHTKLSSRFFEETPCLIFTGILNIKSPSLSRDAFPNLFC